MNIQSFLFILILNWKSKLFIALKTETKQNLPKLPYNLFSVERHLSQIPTTFFMVKLSPSMGRAFNENFLPNISVYAGPDKTFSRCYFLETSCWLKGRKDKGCQKQVRADRNSEHNQNLANLQAWMNVFSFSKLGNILQSSTEPTP